MGLFRFLRARPSPVVHRTWTHAKDVGVFARAPGTRAALERTLAREGIQARCFEDEGGRALEILTRFLPSVLLVWAEETDPRPVLEALELVPGLREVPVLLAGRAPASAEPWMSALGDRAGGVLVVERMEELIGPCLELAPQLLD